MSKNLTDIQRVLDQIAYKDRHFWLKVKGDGFTLQVTYSEADVETGEVMLQKSRKWYISPWMTTSEIVRTAYKAVLCSMEHVVGEHFTYRGKRVFSPHYDVDILVNLSERARSDRRTPPTSGKKLKLKQKGHQ